MCLLHEITHSCPFIHSEMIASITYEKTLLRWCHSRKLAFMKFLENQNRTGSDNHGTVKMIGQFIFDRLCSQVSFCRTNQGCVFFFDFLFLKFADSWKVDGLHFARSPTTPFRFRQIRIFQKFILLYMFLAFRSLHVGMGDHESTIWKH